MAKSIKTHLYCFDDHRAFTDEIMKKFPDVSRYTVLPFQTREDLLKRLEAEKEHNFCKMAIIGIRDTKEQYEETDHFTLEIKKIDPRTGILLLCQPGKIEEVRKAIKFNIDAYVPQNSNFIMRVHNAVKKLISEQNIIIFRKRRNVSVMVLVSFIILSACAFIFAFLRYPELF
jgi:DNA-binding NarL/FixJ family response regulator